MVNRPHLISLGLVMGLLLICTGCTSPLKRMDKYPEVAQNLSDEQRQAILEGRILIGFKKEMVYMALGHPDKVYSKTTVQGAFEQWVYEAYRTQTAEIIHTGSLRYRGQRVRLQDSVVYTPQPYPHTTVVFEDGKVKEFIVQNQR